MPKTFALVGFLYPGTPHQRKLKYEFIDHGQESLTQRQWAWMNGGWEYEAGTTLLRQDARFAWTTLLKNGYRPE